jgi:hypothetical protein
VEDIRKITLYVLFAVLAGGDGVQISGLLLESHFVSHGQISGAGQLSDWPAAGCINTKEARIFLISK